MVSVADPTGSCPVPLAKDAWRTTAPADTPVPILAAISWWSSAGRVIVVTGIAARHAQSVDDRGRSDKQASGINRRVKGAFTMQLVKRPTRDDSRRK